jgi:hypothetical protein
MQCYDWVHRNACPLQWLTFGPTTQAFIDDIKGNATNVMSAAQWHPAMTMSDPFFGTSAQYTSDMYNWGRVNASESLEPTKAHPCQPAVDSDNHKGVSLERKGGCYVASPCRTGSRLLAAVATVP